MVHLTANGVLEDQINFLFIPEKSVKSTNIVVAEMGLDFNFFSELVLDPGFDQLLLVEDLECNNKLRSFLPGQINVTEFAPSDWLADLEVINAPFLRIELFWSLHLWYWVLDLLILLDLI